MRGQTRNSDQGNRKPCLWRFRLWFTLNGRIPRAKKCGGITTWRTTVYPYPNERVCRRA